MPPSPCGFMRSFFVYPVLLPLPAAAAAVLACCESQPDRLRTRWSIRFYVGLYPQHIHRTDISSTPLSRPIFPPPCRRNPLQMHGRDECVELLLRRGAKHDQLAIGGHTVLHLATANRHCQVVKRLVEAGALVDARNAHGNTALHSAAATGTIDVLSVSGLLCSSVELRTRLFFHSVARCLSHRTYSFK